MLTFDSAAILIKFKWFLGGTIISTRFASVLFIIVLKSMKTLQFLNCFDLAKASFLFNEHIATTSTFSLSQAS